MSEHNQSIKYIEVTKLITLYRLVNTWIFTWIFRSLWCYSGVHITSIPDEQPALAPPRPVLLDTRQFFNMNWITLDYYQHCFSDFLWLSQDISDSMVPKANTSMVEEMTAMVGADLLDQCCPSHYSMFPEYTMLEPHDYPSYHVHVHFLCDNIVITNEVWVWNRSQDVIVGKTSWYSCFGVKNRPFA